MKTPLYSRYSYCLLLCLQAVSNGAEIAKLPNVTALNAAGSWNGGVVPGAGDVMLWNNLVTGTVSAGTDLPPMGANLTVLGIKVTNVGGTRNVANTYVGFQNPASASTLNLGAGGIDMSAATQILNIFPRVLLTANQTWNIGAANNQANGTTLNNNEDLSFIAQAASVPFDFGGFTVNTTGAGNITASSGYTFSNGSLVVANPLTVLQGGTSRMTSLTSNFNATVNSGILRLQANSGPAAPNNTSLNSAAPVTVNAGLLELRSNGNGQNLVQSGNITLNAGSGLSYQLDTTGGSTTSGNISVAANTVLRVTGAGVTANNGALISGAISGSGNISYLNTATNAAAFVRLGGNNSGYTGTFSINAGSGTRSLRISSADGGSAAANWEVGGGNTLQIDGVAVQLGTLNGFGTITNSSATGPAMLTIGSGTFGGPISEGSSPATTAITKVGPGTLLLNGTNSFTGGLTVNGGTVVDNTSHTTSGPITVADGATFGTSIKSLGTSISAGNLTVGTGSQLLFDLNLQGNPVVAPLAVNSLLFNGASTIKLTGKNLGTGTFPLLQYTTLAGGSTPVSGLTLSLPPRTSGTMADTGFGIDVTINSTEKVKWNGDVNNDWDVDPTGANVVGTPNWLTAPGGVATRYIQGTPGNDAVTFDDSSSGGAEKTVNLTTTLTPSGLTFDNTTKNYTLTGPGKLSGLTMLEKKGTGKLSLTNTTPNDYTGGTLISAGTLQLGDGVTPGAGIVFGAIENEGTLVLNRPDNFDFNNVLTGLGTLEKDGPNTVNFAFATTFNSTLKLTAGRLRFNAGGVINGLLTGAGELESAANLDINGTDPNTNTGTTIISGGILRLNKPANVDALGGDINITNAATVTTVAADQIANTATVRALGTSADSLVGVAGTETYANVVVNGQATTQLILRHNAVVTGTGTVNNGILGVASSHTASVNAVVMTSPTALVRVAGGSGLSTLNIGSGGITASGGDVQVKFSNSEQPAVLNLAGDLTTTGNLIFSNGAYPGTQLNVVNLSGNRVFNIGAGTTTTFAPDLASTGSDTLNKTGGGTLSLNATCAVGIPGGTTVSDGTLLVNGTFTGSLQVNAAGVLGGSGTLSGTTVVDGAVSPGTAIGKLTSSNSVTFGPDSDLNIGIGSWTGTTEGTHWDLLQAASLVFNSTPSNPLVIHVSGTPTGFTEVNKTMVIATSTGSITGFNPATISIVKDGFVGAGTFAVQLNGNNIELVYTAAAGSAYDTWASGAGLTVANNGQGVDAENDGLINREEFALDGNPLSGKSDGKVVAKLASVGGQTALTLTLPVRNAVIFSGTTERTGAADGVLYRIQASDELGTWNLQVSEVTGGDATAIQAGLPALSPGWTYRTFRSPGAITGDPVEFIRVKIDPAT